MNPLKIHLLKNGRSACGKSGANFFVLKSAPLFDLATNQCKKCVLIFNLDLGLRSSTLSNKSRSHHEDE
jgi:hypothetical protein